uniref:Ig-like domain-containing protein n=1 Tax=Ditylenchus dipsaci TaxID=166011 RepID=A0A915CRG5_9BILA
MSRRRFSSSRKADADSDAMELQENGSLVISRVQANHAGLYECHVSNLAGDDSITYSLNIQSPPTIISDASQTVMKAVVGSSLDILCKSIGSPEPIVTWEKDNLQFLSSDSTVVDPSGILRIKQVKSSDAGEYKCLARNAAGETSRLIQLEVQVPPSVSEKQPSEYSFVQGQSADIQCLVTGQPAPQIAWLRQGVPVADSTPRHTILSNGTLRISNVLKEDVGHYTCQASNPAGKQEIGLMLTVITPPELREPETEELVVVQFGSPILLICPIISSPAPEIKWFINEKLISSADSNFAMISEDRRRLSISQTKETHGGIYKCVAQNMAGEAQKVFNIGVLVAPRLDESTYPRQLKVMEGQRVEIGCPVVGTPPPSVVWLMNMQQLLEPGAENRGVRLSPSGDTIIIDSLELAHNGTYLCVSSNKAGTLDIEVELSVLEPQKYAKQADICLSKTGSYTR